MATAVHKKQSESKYVSCFADSRPDVDITFRDVLLSRPTDHYLVGVDNFSMTNTSLSMIEPQTGNREAFIRIVRNPSNVGAPGANANWLNQVPNTALDLDLAFANEGMPLADLLYVTKLGYDLSIKTSEVILSMQQLMHRLGDVAADVNKYLNAGLAIAAEHQLGGYTSGVGEDTEHLKFSVATDGRVTVRGTRAFWNCFSIEVPATRYQFGLYGPRKGTDQMVPFTQSRRYLSVNPQTGEKRYDKIVTTRFQIPIPTVRLATESAAEFAVRVAAVNAHNGRTLNSGNPHALGVSPWAQDGITDITLFNQNPNGGNPASLALSTHAVTLGASVFSSLERRIALEVGCSLPIKNSPMIDHQRETPDFVLGRWIWRTDPRIESNEYGGSRRYQSDMPACTEYQGAQDRITYHELQAQSKIQTLRIKLFARLRTFDEVKEEWGMRVIALPTSDTDWWHARLHFMSKD